MQKTMASFALILEKDFSVFCNQRLPEIGVTQGLLYFILYIGKHPGCSTAALIKNLHIDWGHAQRSINKLVQDGFVNKKKDEHDKRAYTLTLTPKGGNAFSVSHQVFADWDENALRELSVTEKNQLFTILEKLVSRKGEYVCVRNNRQSDLSRNRNTEKPNYFRPTTMGLPQAEYFDKIRQIASGGCAMIIIGDVPVSKASHGHSLFSQKSFAYYQALVAIAPEQNCRISAQLHQSDSPFKSILKYVPGLLSRKISREELRPLLNAEVGPYISGLPLSKVKNITASFGDAAVLAQKSGFDMVQVHGDRMCGRKIHTMAAQVFCGRNYPSLFPCWNRQELPAFMSRWPTMEHCPTQYRPQITLFFRRKGVFWSTATRCAGLRNCRSAALAV